MQLKNAIGEQAIRDVIAAHPRIGEILKQHDIGCVTCGVGICLLKDVVAIHALWAEIEAQIEAQINAYLESAAAQAA
jgi:bacterioferritin-associated ferredoxin